MTSAMPAIGDDDDGDPARDVRIDAACDLRTSAVGDERALQHAVSWLLRDSPALRAAVHLIRAGDEHALTPAEARHFAAYALRRRRASGSVRRAARGLCAQLGLDHREFVPDDSGVPPSPPGWLASFSHDDVAAIAVFGRVPLRGLGIDLEAPDALDEELTARVLAPGEDRALADAGIDGKAVFSIKEAVFKATWPADRVFLEFAEVHLDPATRTARTSSGRVVHWRLVTQPRVMALAWW